MRWGVEKRMEFIEFRLFWESGINRADLIDQFGVSVPQASKDLTLYGERAPGNLLYDRSAKRYRASDGFTPVFLEPDAAAYLTYLCATTESNGGPSEAWLAATPDFDAMPMLHRRINVLVLRDVLTAVRERQSIEVRYQSMNASRPAPVWRRVTPHALGSDGLRWHIRAFCHIDKKFKDFILSRCLDARRHDAPGSTPEEDTLWHEHFAVALEPNPALSDSQQAVIAQDFEMKAGNVEVLVRKALLYYFQKRLRLDVAHKLDDPHEMPVVVANRADFDAALAEAMA